MLTNLPKKYILQYSRQDIESAVSRIGAEITVWASSVEQNTGKEVLAIPVLRGGIFFFADLAREVKASLELEPGRTRAYQLNQNAVSLEQVKVILEKENLKDRSILLVDDICDSGRTLTVLKDYLLKQGALEVKAAVLIQRQLAVEKFTPDWVGFKFEGSEWFVGYGMEDKNSWSNLPEIYTIEGT